MIISSHIKMRCTLCGKEHKINMILLDVGAAAVCLWHKDYRRTVYWIAAAVLNLTITF